VNFHEENRRIPEFPGLPTVSSIPPRTLWYTSTADHLVWTGSAFSNEAAVLRSAASVLGRQFNCNAVSMGTVLPESPWAFLCHFAAGVAFTGRIREAFGAFPHLVNDCQFHVLLKRSRRPLRTVPEHQQGSRAVFRVVCCLPCCRGVECLTMLVRQRQLSGFLPSDLGMFHFFPG
jgi:hypothetical protein